MPRLASELLFESQAALRMVDNAIGELNVGPAAHRAPDAHGTVSHDDGATPHVLHHACMEIGAILEHLRASRDVLDHTPAQAVTPQHLEHASMVMREAEDRLSRIVALLDPAARMAPLLSELHQ